MNKIKVPKELESFFLGTKELDDRSNLEKLVNSFKSHKKVLVYGEVQSGKTGNLIKYVEHITDEPYLIIYLTGTKNNLLNQNHERFYEHFEELNEKYGYEKYFISRKEKASDSTITALRNILKDGNTYITNELKRPANLIELYSIIKELECNVFIIDDEGDEASLAEKTREQLERIISLPKVTFLSITATPFANLYYNEKFYDDYVKLTPWPGYKGIKDFYDNFIIINDEDIESIEKTIINPLINWANTIVVNDIKDAQILFNFKLLKREHENIRKIIKNFLSNDLINFKKKQIINDDIYNLLSSIDDNEIFISNSDVEKDKALLNEENLDEGYKIIIGGGNLSRGITYKKLLTEVMINSPEIPSPGVLLQRARWFGYRDDHKLIKIYLTKGIRDSFIDLDKLNDWTKEYSIGSGYKKIYKDRKKNGEFRRIDI